jgi:S-DNA-T family DNA segregation ATPase FtsK/SpoIIIE
VAHQAIPGRARILRRGEPPRLIQIAVRGADLA